jgi:RNA polymerase sigma factor (sigma-70 family)
MAGVSVADLELLYRSRYAHFVRVATALLRNEDEAFDVVQDAFLSAIRARGEYRGEGPPEAWVWRIVINEAQKALARRPASQLPDASAPSADDDPRPVRAAILRLPKRQRLVLFLRHYAGLDYRSIAAALEISPGTVGATLNAAHASLRRSLEEVRS